MNGGFCSCEICTRAAINENFSFLHDHYLPFTDIATGSAEDGVWQQGAKKAALSYKKWYKQTMLIISRYTIFPLRSAQDLWEFEADSRPFAG